MNPQFRRRPKPVDPELRKLRAFYRRVARLTFLDKRIAGRNVVLASDLSDALLKVNPKWYQTIVGVPTVKEKL